MAKNNKFKSNNDAHENGDKSQGNNFTPSNMFSFEKSFQNYSQTQILNSYRDIRYADCTMVFGFYNTADITLKLSVDASQIAYQADIVARSLMENTSSFDFKRFLGSDREDWTRQLHEMYVYDRVKSVYYGILSNYIDKWPEGRYTFLGHAMLMNLLKKRSFEFGTNDQLPVNLHVLVEFNSNIRELFADIFKAYPFLQYCMSDDDTRPYFRHGNSEAVLKGLANAKIYLTTAKTVTDKNLFSIVLMDNKDINNIFLEDSFPFCNSFLSPDGSKMYFIFPPEKSDSNSIRWNKSVFLGRAIGLTGNQCFINENPMYKAVSRNKVEDRLVKEEVYAITGIKGEIELYNQAKIQEYLSWNTMLINKIFVDYFIQKEKLENGGNGNGDDSNDTTSP